MKASSRALVGVGLVVVTLGGGLLIGGRMVGGDARANPSRSGIPHRSERVATPRPQVEIGTPVVADGVRFDPEVTGQPTAEKNQSKLWIHDGRWWAAMLSADGELTIHWLEWSTQEWHDTDVLIDERGDVRSDALAFDDELWVVTGGNNEESRSSHARVMRFTYDPATARYTLDPGYPVALSPAGVTGITVARDSGGHPWVAFVAGGQVWFSTTDAAGQWIAPRELPLEGTDIGAVESAIVTLGDEVGILWSNEVEDAIYYAYHTLGGDLDDWSTTRIVVEGLGQADDHLNVKAIEGPGGGLFAVAKTSLDDVSPRNNEKPLVVLLARRSGEETWHQSVVGTVGERHSRPILAVDPEHRELYVFATSPGRTGDIYFKHTAIDDLSFSGGLGQAVLDSPLNSISNPTSTKQAVGADTGIVVLATDTASGRYVHTALSLGGIEPGAGAELPGAGNTPGSGSDGVVLFDETFDLAAPWTGALVGWELSAETPRDFQILAGEGRAIARLAAPEGAVARACRDAHLGTATSLRVSARVQPVTPGSNDAYLLGVRGTEGDLLGLRLLPDGRFAYTDGTEKIPAGPTLALGAWYRLSVTIDAAAGTYTWELLDEADAPIATGGPAALRTDGGTPDRVCFRTSVGAASGSELLIDDVRASR